MYRLYYVQDIYTAYNVCYVCMLYMYVIDVCYAYIYIYTCILYMYIIYHVCILYIHMRSHIICVYHVCIFILICSCGLHGLNKKCDFDTLLNVVNPRINL